MIGGMNRQTRPPCGLSAAAALGIPRAASAAYTAWDADGRPWQYARPVHAFANRLRAHGYTVYEEGDERHLTNVPPEDHTPFSATGWPAASPYPVCMATDVMPPKPGQVSALTGRPLPSLARLGAQLRRDRIDGHPGAAWVKYMNWTDSAGQVWHDKWQPDYARTTSGDVGHIHGSCRTDYAGSALADGYDLVTRTEGADVTLYGWDASHYDAVPSGSRVAAEGFSFMTHKAGGDANDAELAAWWSALKPYRDVVMPGAYWVLYPGSPAGRADAFIARLDSQCPGWRDGPFILQADCEIWGGDTSTRPGRADIEAFCDRLAYRLPKLWPIVYAPKWAYGDSLTGLSYPLWASSYVSGTGTASALYPGDTSTRWGVYSGKVPAILQFTSSATIAGQTTCDANAYRGSFAQLQNLVAPGWAPEEEAMAFIENQTQFNAAFTAAADAYFAAQTRDDMNPVSGAVKVGKLGSSGPSVGVALQSGLANTNAALSMLAVLVRYAQDEAAEIPASAQAIVDTFLADLDDLTATDAAQALAAVLPPDKLMALITALNAFHPATLNRDDVDDQAATRAAREQAQTRIAGSGE